MRRAGKYTRAVFELDNGTLVYDDIRQFGRVEFYESNSRRLLDRVGPDALASPLKNSTRA